MGYWSGRQMAQSRTEYSVLMKKTPAGDIVDRHSVCPPATRLSSVRRSRSPAVPVVLFVVRQVAALSHGNVGSARASFSNRTSFTPSPVSMTVLLSVECLYQLFFVAALLCRNGISPCCCVDLRFLQFAETSTQRSPCARCPLCATVEGQWTGLSPRSVDGNALFLEICNCFRRIGTERIDKHDHCQQLYPPAGRPSFLYRKLRCVMPASRTRLPSLVCGGLPAAFDPTIKPGAPVTKFLRR